MFACMYACVCMSVCIQSTFTFLIFSHHIIFGHVVFAKVSVDGDIPDTNDGDDGLYCCTAGVLALLLTHVRYLCVVYQCWVQCWGTSRLCPAFDSLFSMPSLGLSSRPPKLIFIPSLKLKTLKPPFRTKSAERWLFARSHSTLMQ